jgi:hypothetical protein
MQNAIITHFRCPDRFVKLGLAGELTSCPGYFRFGRGATFFGRTAGSCPPSRWAEELPDLMEGLRVEDDRILLPFDVSEVAANLRFERYCRSDATATSATRNGGATEKLYYFLRPFLGVSVRKHLQRIHLRNWNKVPFPEWPVDFNVENLLEQTLAVILEQSGTKEIPFIWFWPDGAQAAVIMTHDIEAPGGLQFSEQLMDLDESFGIKSAFQLVPEERYAHNVNILERFRHRGFELNVHDLNHDGALFGERQEFIRRAKRINEYARQFGTRGFRAGAMYRRQDWYDAFDLSYDMSVPNVAHLEPQGGGCCTAMPYFIGKILELPLTTIQDYSLFHIIGDYSIDLWKRQIDMILRRNGLISFIVHPDYIRREKEQSVYRDLLEHLASMRERTNLWTALPGDVDRWWRNRAEMNLIEQDGSWRIEGPDQERGRVAFASLQNGRIVYRLA